MVLYTDSCGFNSMCVFSLLPNTDIHVLQMSEPFKCKFVRLRIYNKDSLIHRLLRTNGCTHRKEVYCATQHQRRKALLS